MQPAWANADLIPHVCHHITDVHHLATLSTVNKAINNYLFSTTGGKHWIRAGELVCGEDYWRENASHLAETDPRYVTKINICPWISQPMAVTSEEELERIRWYTRSDKPTVDRLNNTRWTPLRGENYGSINAITKVHDGALIVQSFFHNCNYFVSSKDFRLLRDVFHLAEQQDCTDPWAVSRGKLYMRDRDFNVFRLGIRQDKAIAPFPCPEHSAMVVQAFWAAFRGEIQESLHKIASSLGSDVDLSTLRCHNQTLAEHIIMGGSLNALKVLLQSDSRCVNPKTMISAVFNNREDMAMLVASMIHPKSMNSSSWLWWTLTDNYEEYDRIFADDDDEAVGFDLNLICILECKGWMQKTDRPLVPPYIRMLCSVCAAAHIPTSDGKQLVDIMPDYLTQLSASCDDTEDGWEIMLSNKANTIKELLCPIA